MDQEALRERERRYNTEFGAIQQQLRADLKALPPGASQDDIKRVQDAADEKRREMFLRLREEKRAEEQAERAAPDARPPGVAVTAATPAVVPPRGAVEIGKTPAPEIVTLDRLPGGARGREVPTGPQELPDKIVIDRSSTGLGPTAVITQAVLADAKPRVPQPGDNAPPIMAGKTDKTILPYSDRVKEIQQMLVDSGFNVGQGKDGKPLIDGLEGPLTRAAIKQYGEKMGWKTELVTMDQLHANLTMNKETKMAALDKGLKELLRPDEGATVLSAAEVKDGLKTAKNDAGVQVAGDAKLVAEAAGLETPEAKAARLAAEQGDKFNLYKGDDSALSKTPGMVIT